MKLAKTQRVFGIGLTLASVLVMAGCDEVALPMGGGVGAGTGAAAATGGVREYLVLGSTMNFEECRARGGIIIRDQGSPMVACDPRVRREPVPADEFDHPGSPVPQLAEAIEG